jgi:hypothetical protein
MTAVDLAGTPRSYLATEESYAAVRDLHARNLIVPVVGDFGGAGALRRIGEYLGHRGAVIGAFYASNVEVYLTNRQRAEFCRSLAALPRDGDSWYIGSRDIRRLSAKLERTCAGVTP